jgi:hypothetical protein
MNLEFSEFSHDDIYMLFKRIDKQSLGRITFKQFNDIVLPFSKGYANRVVDRPEFFCKRGIDYRFYFN